MRLGSKLLWLLWLLATLLVGESHAQEWRTELLAQLSPGRASQPDANLLQLQSRARWDAAHLELQAERRSGEQASLRLGEAWWQLDSPSGQWTLGRQRLGWGLTDTVSPGDLMNPRDWRDLSRPLPRPVAALRWTQGAWQAVWAEGGKALLPSGAWETPLPPGLTWAAAPKPSAQAGLRWQTRGQGREANLIAYQGHSPVPQFRLTPQGLQPYQEPMRAVVAQAMLPLDGRSLLRSEIARYWGRDSAPFSQWVLSLDREWAMEGASLYALVQTQHSQGRPPSLGTDLRRALDGQWLTRLQWRDDDGRQVQLEAALRPDRSEHWWRASASLPLGGALELELSWQQVQGRSGRFWARYANEDRAALRLRWVR